MGFVLNQAEMDRYLSCLASDYRIFAPRRYSGDGIYSDTDIIRYGEVSSVSEIEFEEKSLYSFKEVLLPVIETLFYFTEDKVTLADAPQKGAVVFMRSCDVHGLKALDAMYLDNGPEDYYYKRLRKKIKIILIGCPHSYENCFCVSMGTSETTDYDLSVDPKDGAFHVDCRNVSWQNQLLEDGIPQQAVTPEFVTENAVTVKIPENLNARVAGSTLWNDYDSRCIACGRCNFVCPTCTCFTMQDMPYTENGKAGERRRVWASCMVDGFTDVAGGGSYRQKNGQRMRFKVLHKVLDFKAKHGFQMCVGCGRCDDVCPEYISFSHAINGLEQAMKEVSQ